MSLTELADYVDDSIRSLAGRAHLDGLQLELATSQQPVSSLREGESLDWRLADFLYRVSPRSRSPTICKTKTPLGIWPASRSW